MAYAIRKVYVTGWGMSDGTAPTAKEVADELARLSSGFLGVKPTPEQLEQLSSHVVTEAIKWISDEFDLGLR